VPQAEVLLRATGGEPLAALDAATQGLTAEIWTALPGQVARGDGRVLLAMAVPEAVRALQQICHDAMAVAAGAPPRFFPAGAVPAASSAGALAHWSRSLAQAARHEDHPWHAGLLLESLLAQAQQALHVAAPTSATPTSAYSGATARTRTGPGAAGVDTLKP